MHKIVKLTDLTPYHQEKLMVRAEEWKNKNQDKIIQLFKNSACHVTGEVVKFEQPQGSAIFDPNKWNASNWGWFSGELTKRIKKRMGARE